MEITENEFENYKQAEIKVPLSHYKDSEMEVFKYVNQSWLEAQQRAERKYGVKDKNKLSNQIRVRIFHNKVIFLDIYGEKRNKFERMLT